MGDNGQLIYLHIACTFSVGKSQTPSNRLLTQCHGSRRSQGNDGVEIGDKERFGIYRGILDYAEYALGTLSSDYPDRETVAADLNRIISYCKTQIGIH